MIAGMLTKSLNRVKFNEVVGTVGMKKMQLICGHGRVLRLVILSETELHIIILYYSVEP